MLIDSSLFLLVFMFLKLIRNVTLSFFRNILPIAPGKLSLKAIFEGHTHSGNGEGHCAIFMIPTEDASTLPLPKAKKILQISLILEATEVKIKTTLNDYVLRAGDANLSEEM